MTRRKNPGDPPPIPRSASSHFVRNHEVYPEVTARLIAERDQRIKAYHAAAASNPNIQILGDPPAERSALNAKPELAKPRGRTCRGVHDPTSGISRYG
jgi:hypothetical protein